MDYPVKFFNFIKVNACRDILKKLKLFQGKITSNSILFDIEINSQ